MRKLSTTLLVAAILFVGQSKTNAQIRPSWSVTSSVIKTETSAEIMERQRVAPPSMRHEREELEYPSRKRLPNNPAAPAISRYPAVDANNPVLPSPDAPQTVSTSFNAVTGPTETGAFPPDVMGTVGPTQYITFVNGRLRSFTKAGVADGVLNADPDVFFASVMTPIGGSVVLNFTSDPRIRYDRATGRWILIIIDVPCTNGTCTTTAANRVLFAVSNTSTISASTVWSFFQFQADPGTNFADYPTLGIDANALYIGANMFSNAGSFIGTNGYVVRKSTLLTGTLNVTAFANLVSGAAGAGPYTPQGVDNFDVAATEGYFIGVDNATFSTLMIRRVSNPGTASPTISANISLTVPTTTTPNPVTHLGNTGGNNGRLDALDDRLFAAVIRNGRLWTAHNFRVSSAGVANTAAAARNATRWYEIQNLTSTPSLVQSGTIFDNAATLAAAGQFWIPTVMVSGQGHAAFSLSAAGTPFNINTATTGRLSGDALGTTSGTPLIVTASSTAYNPASDPGGAAGRRWGDYSYISLDPLDDMTMWMTNEFCNGTNTYGCQVTKLLAPPPATPASCSPASVATGQASVNIVLTGTAVSGSGFYDPGANLPTPAVAFNHIAGAISGSVTVNSVTYTDPTHVTLNISTVGTPAGTKNVTITNPDGQSLTGNGILTITGGTPTITTSGVFTPFIACAGTPSAEQTFTVSGNNLTANLVVTAPTNLRVSLTSGAGYATSVSLTPSSGVVNTTTIYVRTAGTALPGSLSGNVSCTSTGATQVDLPVSGTIYGVPAAYNVTGGGAACGVTGVAVGLSNSDLNVSYQLQLNGVNTGSSVPGTGSLISFGSQATPGTYTVIANQGTPCQLTMTGSVTITIGPVMNAPTITQPSLSVPTGTIVVNATAGSGQVLEYKIGAGAYQASNTFSGLAPGFYNIFARVQGTTCEVPYINNPISIWAPGTRVSSSCLLYGASPFQDSMWSVRLSDYAVIDRLAPSIPGFTITGINSLATDPITADVYAVLKLSAVSGRVLAKINLQTGVCTQVGNLGHNFSSITFRSDGQLYGATGNGDATNPESLFTINKATGAVTLLYAMGNGADGEIICYNPDEDMIYHWSGNGTVVYEKFSPNNVTYTPTNISITGTTSGETFGAIYMGSGQFIISNISSSFNTFTTGGTVSAAFGSNPDDLRGLVRSGSTSSITASGSTTICSVGGSVLLTLNGGFGSYQWYQNGASIPGATIATYLATTSGVYNCRYADVCGTIDSVAAGIVVTLSAPPSTSNAGPDVTQCGLTYTLAGNTPSIGTGAWTQTSGPGTSIFTNANSPTSDVTVSVAGAYTFTWTIASAPCTPSQDDVVITFVDAPVINAPTVTQPTCLTPTGTIVVNATGTGTLEYSINGGATYQASNTFSGLAPGNYNISVRLQSPPNCAASYAGNPVVINAVPTIVTLPISHDFVPAAPLLPTGWVLNNPNGNVTWVRNNAGNGNVGSAFMDNYNFNLVGQVDEIKTPPFTTGTDSVIIEFDYAHKNFPGLNDRLQVLVSSDCGTTFNTGTNPVFDRSGATLATAGSSTANYTVPAVTDWQHVRLAVHVGPGSPYAANQIMMVNFRSTNGYGNNIFIDNINIKISCVAPGITCPANITVSNAANQCGNTVTYTPTVTGTTPAVTYSFSGATTGSGSGDGSGSFFNTGTTTVTLTATNSCGTASCSFTVTVNDTQNPTITCPAPVTVSCASAVPAPNTGSVTASDNCPGVVVTHQGDVISGQTCANRYTLTRTYRATDASGNFAECTQTITVNDVTPPTLTCPAAVTVSCASAVPAPNTASVTGVSDNCGGVVTVTWQGDVISGQTCANRYTITRTYRATDVCGNFAECTQTITVNDVTPPTLTCPAAVTVSCASAVPAPNIASVTGVSDNCGGVVTVTWQGDVISAQTCANRYTITRTYRATDVCGNFAQCTQTITVNDVTPPTLTCPAPVTVSCASAVPAPNIASVTGVSDNCGGAVTVTFISDVISAQTCANRYTITRTYRATDVCGNFAQCTQTITVNDVTPPTLTCPAPVTVSCASAVPAPNIASVTGVSDNCGGTVTVTHQGDVISGQTCPNRYTITRTYRATDVCGNFAECTQVITVNDQTAPVLTCPANITVTTPVGSCTAVVNFTPTATDNCGGGVTIVSTPASGTAFPIGTTTVNVTATDACGNQSSCSFTVTINDAQLPVITAQPQNRTVCVGSNTSFSVTAITSPNANGPLNYQWQGWNGSAWVNITGATASSLALTNVTLAMNTNSYRVQVIGLCTTITSGFATLYVNALPIVSIATSRPPQLLPTQTINLTAVVSPGGGTYQWFKNNVAIPGATGNALNGLTIDDQGTYKVVYTDPNGCISTSADLVISGVATNFVFIYPNPNDGLFHVRFYNANNETAVVSIFDAKGALAFRKVVTTGNPYSDITVDLAGRNATGVYTVEVRGDGGRLIGAKQLLISNGQ